MQRIELQIETRRGGTRETPARDKNASIAVKF